MPATSKAQFRYIAANRDKLEAQGMNTDEWLKGVKVSKLPERKTASAMDFALPVAGALGGAYAGKLFRDKEDPEDDSYIKPLIGAGVGLGAGLLGNAAIGSMQESSRQADAAKVNDAVLRHAEANGLTPGKGGFKSNTGFVPYDNVANNYAKSKDPEAKLEPFADTHMDGYQRSGEHKGMLQLGTGAWVDPKTLTREQYMRLFAH